MRGENIEMLPADAEKHPARRWAQRLSRRGEIIDFDPAIAGPARQGGRSSASSGTSAFAQAATACALICAANGWVASTTRAIFSVRR